MKVPSQTRRVVRFGAFEIDLSSGELLKHGIKIRLQEQPFQILLLLLERPGEVITREDLRKKLWPSDTFVDFDVGLNSAILRLRTALGDSADSPRFVETLPRRGYRFIARADDSAPPLAHTSPPGDAALVAANPATIPTAEPATELSRAARKGLQLKNWLIVFALAACLAIVVALNSGGLRQRVLGRSGPPRIQSIAVLPLENFTGDPAQDYFVDGMTDAVTTELAQTARIRVISRTSAMQYKGKHKPLPEIAQELNVDAVVEGSVLRSGNRVRITAQLIHAPTDRHLWADSYERELGEIVALQGEVARAIANEVEIKLSKEEQQSHLASLRQVNPDAYEAYLHGRVYVDTDAARENEIAIAMFQRAIALDPNFALAHGSLARAYQYKNWLSAQSKAWTERATHEVQKAISLDPRLADAYLARGSLEWTTSPPAYEGAVKDCRHALSLNPNLADAHYQLGAIYLHIGLLDKSLEELQAAVTLDPRSPVALYRIPRVHLYQQQYAAALAEFERRGFSPDWQRALTLAYLGKTSEAFEFIEKLEKDFPRQEDVASTHAVLLAARGEKKRAEEKIRIAIEAGQGKLHFHHAEYNIASAYALMGKNHLAVKWLHKTADDGLPCYPVFEKDPHLDGLRSDPGFVTFMDKMKSQWERYKATL